MAWWSDEKLENLKITQASHERVKYKYAEYTYWFRQSWADYTKYSHCIIQLPYSQSESDWWSLNFCICPWMRFVSHTGTQSNAYVVLLTVEPCVYHLTTGKRKKCLQMLWKYAWSRNINRCEHLYLAGERGLKWKWARKTATEMCQHESHLQKVFVRKTPHQMWMKNCFCPFV